MQIIGPIVSLHELLKLTFIKTHEKKRVFFSFCNRVIRILYCVRTRSSHTKTRNHKCAEITVKLDIEEKKNEEKNSLIAAAAVVVVVGSSVDH